MKKPNALVQLLEELKAEILYSEVEVVPASQAFIYLDDEAAEKEDAIELSGRECALLFASVATVERLVEALENTDDASLFLVEVGLSGSVLEALERSFVTVDEG